MPIYAPDGGGLKVKIGEIGNFFCSFIPLGNQSPGIDILYESNSVKIGSPVWSRDASKNRGHKKEKKKIKNHAIVIFHPFAGTPPLGRLV